MWKFELHLETRFTEECLIGVSQPRNRVKLNWRKTKYIILLTMVAL